MHEINIHDIQHIQWTLSTNFIETQKPQIMNPKIVKFKRERVEKDDDIVIYLGLFSNWTTFRPQRSIRFVDHYRLKNSLQDLHQVSHHES